MLRPGLYEVVQELAEEDNLPISRVCGYLIEQALVNRGLWDEKLRERIAQGDVVEKSPATASFNKLDLVENKMVEQVISNNSSLSEKNSDSNKIEITDDLLALAKKLKALKALELL